MRAPPESFRPMTGAPIFIARSITLQIFSAYASDSEPPKTVKSWVKTKTSRPSIGAVAGDHAVAEEALLVQTEVVDARVTNASELDERPRVEQQVESLARRQLAARVLLLDSRRAAAELDAALVSAERSSSSQAGSSTDAWRRRLRALARRCVFAQDTIDSPASTRRVTPAVAVATARANWSMATRLAGTEPRLSTLRCTTRSSCG